MITAAKIRLYHQYDGDVDGFARAGSQAQRAAFPAKEWQEIEELLANIQLEEQGLLADAFRQHLHSQLAVRCDKAETIELLRQATRPSATAGKRRRFFWLLLVGGIALALLAAYLLLAGG